MPEFSVWLSDQGLSKKTVKNYVSDVRLFARWLDEQGGSLTSLQGAEVENYVAHLAEIGKPQTSVNRYLASLRKFEVFWTAKTSLRGSQEELSHQNDQTALSTKNAGLPTDLSTPPATLPAPVAKKNHPLNVPSTNQAPKSDQLPKQKILEQFAQALAADGCKANSIKNYVVDIDLFAKHYSAIAFNEVCTKPKVADYLRQLRFQGLAKSTVRRREASLKKFTAWAVKEGFISQDPFENGNQNTKMAKPVFSLFRSQPKLDNSNGSPQNLSQAVTNLHSGSNSSSGSSNASSSSSAASWSGWLSQAFRRYNDSRVATYLHLAILIIFATSIGIFGYQQFVSETDSPLAYPSAPVTPGRILSFQGRVTDTGGTPITSPINMEFRLYNSEDDTGTNVLLWETSPACSIDPDDDGIFSTILGQDCGSGIGPEVFSENSQVWLEVQVASEILEPRQRIASVAYALNSETLQGFPPSLSGDINTIPVINALGELIIGANNPKLIASSGAFLIQGESMIFRTETGTGGDITFQPDGEGTINFYSSTTDQNSIYVSNPNLTSGNLIHGYIGNNTATGNLLYLSSGSTEEEKFSVSASGNTRVAGNLTVDTSTLFVDAASNRVGIGTTAPGQVLDVDGNALIQGSIIVGNGASSLSQDSNQTRLHGSSGLKFTTWNGVVLEAMRIAHTTGYVGIGTTAPSQKLDVIGAVRLGAAGGAYDVLNTAGTGLGNDASGDLYWGNDPLLTSANLGDFGVSSVANSDGTLTISPTTGDVIASLNLANANTWTGAQTFSTNTYFPGSGIWDSTGNVGIGTTNPTSKLTVGGASSTISNDTGDITINAASNNISLAGDNLINVLNAYFAGNVGIGNSSPTRKLSVTGDADIQRLYLADGTAGNPALSFVSDTNTGMFRLATDTLSLSTAGTSRLTINSSGNVGIGTISPQAKLVVIPAAANEQVFQTKSLRSSAALGSELVTNGDFNSSLTGWTATGWTWTSGKADHNTGNTSALSQSISITSGTTYQVFVTVSDLTEEAGVLTAKIGSEFIFYDDAEGETIIWENGEYKQLFTATTTGTQTLTFIPTSGFDGAVDNITIKAITNDEAQPNLAFIDDTGSIAFEAYANSSLANTFLGKDSGQKNTSGDLNTAVGYEALANNLYGSDNTALGGLALKENTSGYMNTAVGTSTLAGNTTGYFNTAVGANNLMSNTYGRYNTALGANNLTANISGYFNTAIGANVLTSNTNGFYNIGIGTNVLSSNTTGGSNLAVGNSALNRNQTGTSNIAVGGSAMYFNTTGYQNLAIGNSALYFADSATYNMAVGSSALMYNNGSYNVGLGGQTLYFNSAGSYNTVAGYKAGWGQYNNSFNNSSIFGYQAGYALSTGSNNSLFGYKAGDNLTTGSNNIVIGYDIDAPTATATQTLNIGNLIFATGLNGTGTTISAGNVGIGTSAPDARLSLGGGLGKKLAIWEEAGTGAFQGFGVQQDVMEWVMGPNNSGTLTFGWGDTGSLTNVMTVKGSGRVGIGTTNPVNALTVAGAINVTGPVVTGSGLTLSEEGAYKRIQSYDSEPLSINPLGNNVGIGVTAPAYKLELPNVANSSGQGRANAWQTYSDIRYKENVTIINQALDKILQLKGVTFDWKSSGINSSGFIAQEVELVIPDLVGTDINGFKSIDYGRFTPYLVEAIKQQQAQINNISGELTTLNSDSITANTATITEATVDSLEAITVSAQTITSNSLIASTLQTVSANITGTLSAASANIGNTLTTASANITNTLTAATANITGTLTAQQINVGNLNIGGETLENYIRNLIAQIQTTQSITPATDEFSAISLSTQDLTVTDEAGNTVAQIDNQGNANLDGTVTSRRQVADEMDALYLTAQDLQADSATISELEAQSARIAALEAQEARFTQIMSETATISGTLYAENIETSLESRQISDFEQRVRDLVALERAQEVDSSPSTLTDDPDTLAIVDELSGEADLDADPSSTVTTDEFGTVIDGGADESSTATDSGNLNLIADGSLSQIDGDLNITGLLSADLASFSTSLNIKSLLIGESFLSFNTLDDDQCDLSSDALCNTFAIQPSGEGRLSLMADALVITKNGGIIINTDVWIAGQITAEDGITTSTVKPLDGQDLEINLAKSASDSAQLADQGPTELIIRGDDGQEVAAFNASGSARFNKVVIASDSTEEVGYDGLSTTYESNATTGTATLLAGKLKAIINNPNVTDQTLIYVTPQGSTANQVVYVANKVADDPATPENEASFTVAIDTSVETDITFNYWLVEAQAGL